MLKKTGGADTILTPAWFEDGFIEVNIDLLRLKLLIKCLQNATENNCFTFAAYRKNDKIYCKRFYFLVWYTFIKSFTKKK